MDFELLTKLVCWPVGVGATLFTVLRIWSWSQYSDLDRSLDSIKGQRVSFPITGSGLLALGSWAVLIAM